jgi:hypothetical protein
MVFINFIRIFILASIKGKLKDKYEDEATLVLHTTRGRNGNDDILADISLHHYMSDTAYGELYLA